MFYREAGQFKATYEADQGIFPIRQDFWAVVAVCVLAAVAVPMLASEYLLHSILLPFLLYAIAAMGLNILLGYCGQISLGTAGFMAVGAFTAYKFATAFEFLPAPVLFILAGLVAALVGVVFGLPSLRIKGFYLAVTTLGAHFLIEWVLTNFGWFKNYSPSGVITAPPVTLLGFPVESAESKYLFTLAVAVLLALLMKNMARSDIGRAWMAVRDMDVAAEVIGIDLLRTKLIAFAVSSFYCGVAGAMYVFFYVGTVEPQAFTINLAFFVLFMVIIGGLGTVLGSFLGAGFIIVLPIVISNILGAVAPNARGGVASNIELIVFGCLIVFFLIVEPAGLARLWAIVKEKLRLWPFPY